MIEKRYEWEANSGRYCFASPKLRETQAVRNLLLREPLLTEPNPITGEFRRLMVLLNPNAMTLSFG